MQAGLTRRERSVAVAMWGCAFLFTAVFWTAVSVLIIRALK